MTTTLYRRGRVRSPADPFATALLVDGGTVAWVGSEGAADALSADVTVDLDDAWLAPAFVDAHVHATSTGLALSGLDLTGGPSLAAALDRVEQAARAARGGVLLGTGWDDTAWPEQRPPTAAELDRASYGGVVYLARTDVHSAVASSALLAAAPAARAAAGFVGDGLVRQEAHHVVRRAAYAAVSPGQRAAAQRATLDRAAELGIACVHECGGPDIGGEDDFTTLLALEHGVEVVGYWGELDGVERARALGAVGAGGDLFADGALGSHTACLSEPYLDEPTTGTPTSRPTTSPGTSPPAPARPAGRVPRHRGRRPDRGAAGHRRRVRAGRAARGACRPPPRRARRDAARRPHRDAGRRRRRGQRAAGLRRPMGRCDGHVRQPPGRRAGTRHEPVRRAGRRGRRPRARVGRAGDAAGPVGDGARGRGAPHPGSGLSARAAFSAHTRGGWRAARVDDAGELAPGAPATFAVWDLPGELVVQTPDTRVSAWSTDPRSGVAGLPDLAGPDPCAERTVVRGARRPRSGRGTAPA